MMIRIPGVTTGGSLRINRFTELVDLAPSLVRAAGLDRMPPCPEVGSAEVDFCTEGSDLMELLEDPIGADWKNGKNILFEEIENLFISACSRFLPAPPAC